MILRQFNGGLKLQGAKEQETMHGIISRVRRQKGDVWLCHKHHMYSDRQQEIMVKMLSKDFRVDIDLEEEEPKKKGVIKAGALNLKEKEPDTVNHPPHYKTGGIETIDFIEAKELDYCCGNVIKYVTRAKHKGNELEDLKKGLWYLNRAIEKLEK